MHWECKKIKDVGRKCKELKTNIVEIQIQEDSIKKFQENLEQEKDYV